MTHIVAYYFNRVIARVNPNNFFKKYFLQNELNPLSVHGVNMRTTSSLESLNSQLNRTFGRARPNIFQFIDHIKSHESSKCERMAKLVKTTSVSTKQLERKRKKDKELEQNIINVCVFLESMANKDMLPKSGMNSLYLQCYYSLHSVFSLSFKALNYLKIFMKYYFIIITFRFAILNF